MVYKKFYVNIIVRVIFLVATCFLIAFSVPTKKTLLILNHTLLLLIQIILLIRYLNRINYELADFFESISNGDYNFLRLPRNKGKSFDKLYDSLSEIETVLKESKIENILKSQYLFTAIENVATGLIWFDENGDVILINKATRQLLNFKSIQNIKELDKLITGFTKILKEIKPSENKLVKLNVDNEVKQLSINATELIQEGKHIKLISIQNIKSELDEAELESWQKLIRVLAHEIMNSIGPITTTTTAIAKYFRDEQGKAINKECINNITINNTLEALEIIEDRSIGLKDFVANYRQLTNLPKPNFKKIRLQDFIERIVRLFNEGFSKNDIKIHVEVNPNELVLIADEKLISHVLINLIKNSVEAFGNRENPEIKIVAYKEKQDEVIICVSDNGHGIPSDVIDKIFIPFFTTKDEGSGIGLSLSRQIMRLHKGSIDVNSLEIGTEFRLSF